MALVVRAWPLSRLAALLLVPDAVWIAFATALTWGDLGAELAPRAAARPARPTAIGRSGRVSEFHWLAWREHGCLGPAVA